MNGRPLSPRRLWWLAAGFALWCVALAVLYALHAIGCAFGWPAGPLRVSLAVVLLLHVLAIGWLWRYRAATSHDSGPERIARFLQTVVIWTLIGALIATLITFGPALLLTTCV